MTNKVEIRTIDIVVVTIIALSMLGSLVYGFFLLKENQKPDCWSQYSTENEAIQNCETPNE